MTCDLTEPFSYRYEFTIFLVLQYSSRLSQTEVEFGEILMTTVTGNNIVTGLSNLGLTPGSRVLVHSSLSSFGHVGGGADAVIDALLEVVGPAGTVLVPTLTGTESDSPEHPPIFDPDKACWTGRIPEIFRRRPEAKRSIHPTHSVAAIGADALKLTEGHINSITPCDGISPYGQLTQMENGYILLLGAGHQSNTMFHHVEEIAGVDYHMQREFTQATVVANGESLTRHYLLHQWGTPRRFDVMENIFIERGIQQTGQIGESTVRLINANLMVRATLQCLRSNMRILCR